MELGSLIRATNLWGYTDLMRELGADPLPFLRRFDIPPGIEHQEDAFMSLAGFVRMLEASAAELDCPDFGLRLARWQGLGILGPVAVSAQRCHLVRRAGGDRSLPLRPFARPDADGFINYRTVQRPVRL